MLQKAVRVVDGGRVIRVHIEVAVFVAITAVSTLSGGGGLGSTASAVRFVLSRYSSKGGDAPKWFVARSDVDDDHRMTTGKGHAL
ncbi:hypothetical protein [Streptomyces sp. RKAG293]|uniref:hypothetical protein n=1 Tax=Streptomyces sp. RKAG293 TaxID=2893403 RepID=UPI002034804E|nr:hypothetical protein [Streptomyces sp. RKAG293]MCM2424104.1 hypothetical protein [Streptomyces sp. RKAG293]